MNLTDPIGDMLTRIRNAARTSKESVDIPSSNLKVEVAKVLKEEGYTLKYEVLTKRNKKILRIILKYGKDKKSIITNLKRISTPGRRTYVGKGEIPRIMSGFGTVILSTSQGILTDNKAREKGLGGEVLAYVW